MVIGVGWRRTCFTIPRCTRTRVAIVLPPYRILNVDGLKIGLLGLSTERIMLALRPKALPLPVMDVSCRGTSILRNQEKVDLVFLASEFGLAKNVYFGENYDGIAVILSSDMHEETREAVVTRNGAIVTQVQDGTRLGQLDLTVRNGQIVRWSYDLHLIDASRIRPNLKIAAMIRNERKDFVASPFFKTHVNPFNDMVLKPRSIQLLAGRRQHYSA